MIGPPALAASLAAVGDAMRDAQDRWWIIGSAAVALHGADPGLVADVDVLLGIADARRILPALGSEAKRGAPNPHFRSTLFGTWCAPPLPVEFMAGFRHRSETGWSRVRLTTRVPIAIGAATVFAPDRAELQRLLTAMGRPKDVERARRLAAPGPFTAGAAPTTYPSRPPTAAR